MFSETQYNEVALESAKALLSINGVMKNETCHLAAITGSGLFWCTILVLNYFILCDGMMKVGEIPWHLLIDWIEWLDKLTSYKIIFVFVNLDFSPINIENIIGTKEDTCFDANCGSGR